MNAKEWIEKRYGLPSVEVRTIHIATVPVMNGVAIGVGTSQEDALYELVSDLRGGQIPIEIEKP